MAKFNQSDAQKRYMTGLWNADSKGFASGQDPNFSERDNPYKQSEHRQFWLYGFRRARAALNEHTNEWLKPGTVHYARKESDRS